jgi:uncharacterized OsmC-like protein
MSARQVVKLRATGNCPSHARSDVSIRDLTFFIDEPLERGGSNFGPTPTDTVLSALIGCTNVIGHKCANKLGVDIGHLDISMVCDFDRSGAALQREVDVPFESIVLTIKCSGAATADQLLSVANEVRKYCPVSKLFRQAGTRIEENWQAAG